MLDASAFPELMKPKQSMLDTKWTLVSYLSCKEDKKGEGTCMGLKSQDRDTLLVPVIGCNSKKVLLLRMLLINKL